MAQWLQAIRIVQIILSISVIIFILLQVRGAGLGSVFGGSSAGSVFKTRRGVERLIFNITIVFVVLFAIVSLLSMVIHWVTDIGRVTANGAIDNGNTTFSISVPYTSTFKAGSQEGILVLYAFSNADSSIVGVVMVKELV